MNDLVDGIIWYIVFVFSVTIHEASHALAAKIGGDDTAYQGGQVSLDPVPHIRRSPFGMVLLPVVSLVMAGWPIGFASAPYDPDWADRHPRRAAWMALAGPGANFAVVLVCVGLVWAGRASGHFVAPASVNYSRLVGTVDDGSWAALGFILSVMLTMNLVLLVLNLIPLPPLDGASALGVLLPDDWARRLRHLGNEGGLAVVGMLLVFYAFGEVFAPVFDVFLKVLYPDLSYH